MQHRLCVLISLLAFYFFYYIDSVIGREDSDFVGNN